MIDVVAAPRLGARGWAMLFALSLLWGGSFFFVEIAVNELPPLSVVAARVGIAAAALIAIALGVGVRLGSGARAWPQFLVMGALNGLVPYGLIAWGQTEIGGGLASILNATTPLFSVVLAPLLIGEERLTRTRFGGVLLGLAGVIALVGPDALRGLGPEGLGQLAVLAAACSYALAAIYGRRLRGLSPLVAATGQIVGTFVLALPLALILDRPWTLMPSVAALGALLGLGLLSTALAYLLYFRLLAVGGATNAVLVTFLIPLSAASLGALFLGERLDLSALLGMALIFAGIVAVDGRVFERFRR